MVSAEVLFPADATLTGPGCLGPGAVCHQPREKAAVAKSA